MLKLKNSVIPKVFWVFARRINRFSMKPRRLGLREKPFGFSCSAERLSPPWPCLETRRQQIGVQSAALLQKAYTMPNG